MTPDVLQRIFAEAGPDFSAEICPRARLDDLDHTAVEVLRRLWQRKSPDQDIATRPMERLLADAELVVDGRLTYAALILLGKREALGKHLAQAEVVFEYRSNEAPGPAADRHEFRQGFLLVLDEIWRLVNLRNDLQHFQQRFFVWDVPTFSERLGRGRGVQLLLSQRFYRRLGKAGVYTRKRGLDRETNKALLIRHLRESGDAGCPVSELQQVLPAQSRDQLKRLLGELRHEGRARLVGERRGARWRAEGGG